MNLIYTKSRVSVLGMLLLFLCIQPDFGWSQCTNTTNYPGTGISLSPTNGTGTAQTITTCQYAGEYYGVTTVLNGSTYKFSSSISTDFLTVHSGTYNGTVVGTGTGSVTVVGTGADLFVHTNSNNSCGTQSSCRTSSAQCTSCAFSGCQNSTQYPSGSNSLATTNTSGAVQTITTCQFGGEYHVLTTVLSGKSYISASSVSTDFITVRVGSAGGTVLAQGTTPLTYTTTSTSDLYVHINTNNSCGTASTCRTTTVQCANCVCINTNSYGVADLNTGTNLTGAVQTVASCTFAGDYNTINNAIGGKTYQIASTISTDFLTLRSGSYNGAIVTSGTTPLTVVIPSTGTYYLQINSNSNCGIQSTCRNTTAQCMNCVGAPLCVTSPTSPANGATGICPSSAPTLSWPTSSGATSYDVYFGTSSTPPFVTNVAGTTYSPGALSAGTYYWKVLPRNAGGNASGCNTWSFVVIDVTPPAITCPANVTANNSPSTACSAVVTYGSISATDNCTAPSITLVSGLASNSVFPLGITTMTYRAADPSGNSSTCSFYVWVKDATPPVISCPSNIVGNNATGQCGAIRTYTTPTATDNCSGLLVSQTSGLPSGSSFPVGVTTNIWKATDAGNNMATCSFNVTINDVEKPTVACPPNILKGNDYGQCSADVSFLGTVQFSDNCLVKAVTNTGSGTYGIGTTNVIWKVTDNSNNTATCVQTVTVEDREYPVLTCPSNKVVKTDAGDCIATVNYNAIATDNCSGVSVDYDIPSGSSFPIGISNVTATATDAAGNSVSCYFQVNVGVRAEECNGLDDDCDGWIDEAENWASVAKVLATDGASQDQLGESVSVDGDYAIVGANKKNPGGQNVGAAYILFRNGGAWTQLAKLSAPDAQPGDNFGAAVSVSGGIAAVGAPFDDEDFGNQGSVYLFYQNPNNSSQWSFLKKVTAGDAAAAAYFGSSVALQGEHLLVGAASDDEMGVNAGAAYVFDRNTGGADNWGQVSKLTVSTGNADDNFGVSVALDGDYAVIGANGVDAFDQNVGAAYIFRKSQFGPNGWNFVAKLTAPAGANSNLGASVDISGSWAFVGADNNDKKGMDAGAVYLFYKNQNGILNSWGLHGILLDNNGAAGDHFGSAVGVSEPYAVVTARGDNPFGAGSGRGFVYLLDGDNWVLVNQLTDGGGQAGDALGSCAAISNRTIILGAPLDNVGTFSDQGSVSLFEGLCADAMTNNEADQRNSAVSSGTGQVACFPQPFSESLNIHVSGVVSADAKVIVLSSFGQQVASLYKGAIDHELSLQWHPENLGSGVYFVRILAGEQTFTQAVMYTR